MTVVPIHFFYITFIDSTFVKLVLNQEYMALMLKQLIGTGDWAIGMGELYSNCEVTGTDLSVSVQF